MAKIDAPVTVKEIHELARFFLPNKNVAAIRTRNYKFCVGAEEIDRLDGADIAMPAVLLHVKARRVL